MDFIDCLVDSAIEENSPIILQLAEAHFKYLGLEKIVPAILNVARDVNIPICIHLDHGQSLKTVIKAIQAGFNSVMFDGSRNPLDENIRLTKEVVLIAHDAGISVEGEIGVLAGIEDDKSAEKSIYPTPQEVIEYARRTGIDAVAIACGTCHGAIKNFKGLEYDLIRDSYNVSGDFAVIVDEKYVLQSVGELSEIDRYLD